MVTKGTKTPTTKRRKTSATSTSKTNDIKGSKTLHHKALSRKEKLELIRRANQMMEKVWERIHESSNANIDAQSDRIIRNS